MSMNLLSFDLKAEFPHIFSYHIFNMLGRRILPFIRRTFDVRFECEMSEKLKKM